MRGQRYQIALISLGILASAFLAYFFYQELFPEYRIYQNDYIALEEFRATYSEEVPPTFKTGVKQIIFEREDKGPATIDRCTSCHVALQIPYFSPTTISHDINGNIVRSADGTPIKVANPDYIWTKIDQKIASLTDAQVNQQLEQEGNRNKIKKRQRQAAELEALKTTEVDGITYDVTKVLQMHPLIGKETRPFEFHPIDEYGCTTCHSGNGRGLTTEKAHGPVFDGEYEIEHKGYVPKFLEKDSKNDPEFAQIFNHKPDDSLLFQTTPILVGNLIQASCVQCHKQASVSLQGLADHVTSLASKKQSTVDAIKNGYANETKALLELLKLKTLLENQGITQTIDTLEHESRIISTSIQEQTRINAQLTFLRQYNKNQTKEALNAINARLTDMLGNSLLITELEKTLVNSTSPQQTVDTFLKTQQKTGTGTLFAKWEALNLEQELLKHVEETQQSFSKVATNEMTVSSMESDIDWLTKNYQRGQQLYLSQACYACHKISGFARGGVGPELTRAGDNYPWYLKESIVWPQADLKTSTMPNFMLDHIELEDLMTFLLAQKGPSKVVSNTQYKVAVQEWEAGRKMPWEQPVPPSKIHDLRYSMTVFATEGCASCHRLKGFESNVGFSIENEKNIDFNRLYKERIWFEDLFPEEILGSTIAQTMEQYQTEIDQHIIDNVRKNSILEEIESKFPDSLEALYSNFRYASRAKNDFYTNMKAQATTAEEKQHADDQLKEWKERTHRVLMMYIQEYGLGRLVGPRPNWSGVYRSDEWLMEHFRNPTGHVPRSIMPVLPFDESKFSALTYMLDVLGKQNRDAIREIWSHTGFRPDQAYKIHCAQCHGEYLQGNGPVSIWIYPIPKNLRNAEFLRNLTKENAIQSISHGIKGTPMPPWGETPKDKQNYDGIPVLTDEEIVTMVNWLYSSLPGGLVIKGSEDVPKWHYSPENVLQELEKEGGKLTPTRGDP